MSPSGTGEDLPGLRPASSRKRKETSRFRENGDAPLPKKKRVSVNKMPARKGTEPPTHSSPSTRTSTADPEEVGNNENDTSEDLPDNNPESVDGIDDDVRTLSDNGDNKVEVVEESADSEMSKPITGTNLRY